MDYLVARGQVVRYEDRISRLRWPGGRRSDHTHRTRGVGPWPGHTVGRCYEQELWGPKQKRDDSASSTCSSSSWELPSGLSWKRTTRKVTGLRSVPTQVW